MLDQMEELKQKEYQAKQLLNRAEYKALQAQVNPHFLYNTLDMMNWMAVKGETDKIRRNSKLPGSQSYESVTGTYISL